MALLFFSLPISSLQVSTSVNQEASNSSVVKIEQAQGSYSNAEKVKVSEHKITSSELGKLKTQIGVHEEGKNYNQQVNGHGTGLSPPTAEEWSNIAQNTYVIDNITYQNYQSSIPSVDLSATPWFPPIGNQGSQGSCVAWSVGYYIKTFQEAKEHGWDFSTATWEGGYSGHPSASFQNKIVSPAFIYNLINDGLDDGSSFHEAIELVSFIGASSWEKMPYNRLDYTTWPSEAAWTEAPYYRGNSSGYQTLNMNTDADLDKLKNWLASGNLATIGADANKFSTLLSGTDLWTLDNYNSPTVNHAGTIIGYDDNFAYTEAGNTSQGAFKVANSWGIGTGSSSWEKVSDGFYWISYEAMKLHVSRAMFYFDSVNYQPSLMAKFRIDHTKRSESTITIGLGTPTAPIQTKVFSSYNQISGYVFGGNLPFCSNNIVLDITEFKNQISTLNNQPFFMKVRDEGTLTTGTITYFSIENTNASGTPIQTKQNQNVFLNVTYLPALPTLTVTPTSGPPSGAITLNGTSFTADSSVNISYLNPITSMWIPIINNLSTASMQNFTYTLNAPDLLQSNPAGDNSPLFGNIIFRAQDNGNSYNSTTPYIQWRRGLTNIDSSAATGLYGNNTNLASTVFVQNGQSINVAGKWFSPGNATLFWDGITDLGTWATDETGLFSATVLVPSTTAGQHTLVIRDGGSDFCVALSRLPTVASDYADLWHTIDFAINLTPDFAGTEAFYRINNGSICNVTANGQPVISTEGSNNVLEFWGVWSIGNSSFELSHSTLTGIQLDKTLPDGSIQINNGATSTASNTVTLTVTATDSLSGISQIRFSNNGIWDQTAWEPYAYSKNWQFTNGDGVKTVYYQIKDNAGLITTLSSSIILDTPKPTPSPSPSPTATPTPVTNPAPTPNSTPSPSESPSAKPSPEIPEFPSLTILGLMLIATLALTIELKRKMQTKR